MLRLVLNGRFMSRPITGVERYAQEMLRRLPPTTRVIRPVSSWLQGPAGHLWEQTHLRWSIRRGEALWSPCNTGPIGLDRHVITVHDIAPVDHPEWFSTGYGRWLQLESRSFVRRSLHVLTVSDFTKQRICEALGASPDDVAVVPNGVDERFLSGPPILSPSQRRALGVPDGRYLLALGTSEPRKNLRRLIEGAARAVERHPDVSLIIAGLNGQNRVFSTEKSNHVGGQRRIKAVGYVPDHLLPSLYASASGFVYVPLYEGFGLPPLEAMAVGVPCVISDIPALRESGAPAILVDPTDVTSIEHGIDMLIRGDHAEIVSMAKAVAEGFTWERSIGLLRETFLRLGIEP